jgi:cell pole-organizing protein PopZ
VLAEFEAGLVIEDPVVVEAVESERRQAPAWEADAPSFAAAVEHEAELEAPRTNGHRDYASAAPRTLEDSVKDLLRPMLRQWLDENMARVLTSALRDELKDNPARFQQD